MDLEKAFHTDLEVSKQPVSKVKFAAIIHAGAMSAMGIRVSTSTDIGEGYDTGVNPIFTHKCVHTSTNEQHVLFEDAREFCGEDAIVIMYEYAKPPLAMSGDGEIRMVDPDGHHYKKKYSSQGTFAFRYDSYLSHLSIMKGYHKDKAPYPLPQGRILPASSTDESVKGAIPKSLKERSIVLEEFRSILEKTQQYLHPQCAAFMQRHLSAGCLGAYGNVQPRAYPALLQHAGDHAAAASQPMSEALQQHAGDHAAAASRPMSEPLQQALPEAGDWHLAEAGD